MFSVRRQARDALCGKIYQVKPETLVWLGRFAARNAHRVGMVKSLAPGAPACMNMQGQKEASHIFALQHEAKTQAKNQTCKSQLAIFRQLSVEFRIKSNIQPSGDPLASIPFCSTFYSNVNIAARRCIGAMTSVTSTRLVLQEIRAKQQSLDLDDQWIQYQRQIASLFDRWRLAYAKREALEAVREALEQAAREQLEHERIARLWRPLEYLALLLLSILRFLLGCSKFGGFQNRERPRCTTMPWNIWPSLVVLWGVCWMFVNTPFIEFDTTQFNSAFDDEQLPLFVPSKTFPSKREILQMH
jgi:hypothetical protein